MNYVSFNPEPFGFPGPRIPLLPWLTRDAISIENSNRAMVLPLQARARFYQRARYALTEAFRLCGVGPDGAALIPAYHCRTMLDPALRLGAEIGLYAVDRNLAPKLSDIVNCVARCTQPVKALLVTHYFGFPQDLKALKEFCTRQAISLIEDCSHCLPAAPVTDTVGTVGRYSIWSPYKFFPSEEGGMLVAHPNETLDSLATRSTGLRREARTLFRVFERSKGHVPLPSLADIDMLAENADEGRIDQDDDQQMASDLPSDMYEAADEHSSCSMAAKWIMRHNKISELAQKRRDNYQHWARVIEDLPHGKALFPILPERCIPYMFPLQITRPHIDFVALKRIGMPIWRWDDLALSDCTVAMDYRLNLLHLPCHQALTDVQMNWMTTAITNILTARSDPYAR